MFETPVSNTFFAFLQILGPKTYFLTGREIRYSVSLKIKIDVIAEQQLLISRTLYYIFERILLILKVQNLDILILRVYFGCLWVNFQSH